MSATIDERVVSMQFDNKQFESNVKTSMSTIDKLKQSLNFNGAAKGLENVSSAAKNCNMTPLSNAVETVRVKFSALEVMAVTALANITNQAVNAGKRLVSAFTIDPIKSGFQEYETQINAVQTILANTQSKGTTLDDVNNALDTLNAYADKTIYNFTEMTRNIGTFTAAGIDLETSVNAIQGIANLAAVSGSNAQQASTAMYQLSQALASGTVKLMDWNSVVNAGMGGQVFQDALKETARVHKIAIDDMIKKQGSFRETLSEGWLTSEILTETLQKFTLTTEGLTDAQIEQNRAMLKAKGYTDEQIEEIFKLGETATNAATKVKTFTQLMDTLKEAAQSGWTQTWELIVGDFDQAKTLWTDISDTFSEMIGKSAEKRNNFLSKVLTGSTWDELIKSINEAGVKTKDFENTLDKTLSEDGVNVDALVDKYGSLEEAFKKGAVSSKYLRQALKELHVASKEGMDLSLLKSGMEFRKTGDDVKQLEKALVSLGYSLTGKDGKNHGEDGFYGTLTRDAVKAFQKDKGLKITGIVDEETINELKKATRATNELSDSVFDLVDGVTNLGGREVLIEGLKNAFNGLLTFVRPIKRAFDEVFKVTPEQVFNVIQKFADFTKVFKLNEDQMKKLQTAFEGFFSVIGIGLDFAKELGSGLWDLAKAILPGVGDGVLTAASKLGSWLKNLRASIKENKIFAKAVSTITNLLKAAVDKIKDLSGEVKKFFAQPEVQKWIKDFKMDFTEAFSKVGEKLKAVGGRFVEFFNKLKSGDFTSISDAFKNFKETIIDFLFTSEDGNIFERFINSLKEFGAKANEYLLSMGIDLEKVGEKISNFFKVIKNFLGDNIGGILALGTLLTMFLTLKKIAKLISVIADPLSSFGDIAEALQVGIKKISKAMSFNLRAQGVKAIAEAIGILAVSLVALTMVKQENLWSSVGALLSIVVALGALIFVIGKFGGNLKDINFKELGKLSGSMIAISGSLMLFAMAAKTLAGVNPGDLLKAGGIIAGFVGLAYVLGKVTKYSGVHLANFAKMMLGISASLLILSVSVGILGKMNVETLIQGIAGVGVLLLMIAGMMKASKTLEKDTPRFAVSMAGLSASLLLMSVAVGILGKMKTETLIKGTATIGVFLLMIAGIMKATNKLSRDIPKFGLTMMGLSFGLLAIAAAVKVLSGISTKDIIKGVLVITAFAGITALMIGVTKTLTKNSKNAGQIGLMMLSFAGAMLILSGSIAILAMIKPEDLAKATLTIAAIAGIYSALMYFTQFAKVGKNVKATVIAMAAAIGILAISIAALLFIDYRKLASATAALSTVMSMFALMVASTKFIGTKTIGALIVLTGIVAILASVIYLLSDIPADGSLKIAASLSSLIIALSVACKLLSAVPIVGALKGVAALAIISAGLAGIIIGYVKMAKWLSGDFPEIGTNLSNFMKNLEPFIEGAKNIDSSAINSVSKIADMISTLVSANLKDKISKWLFGGDSSLKTFGDQLKPFGKALAEFTKPLEGIKVDTDTVDTLVDGVAKLAEAANKVPKAIGVGLGIGGFVSVPMLDTFRQWIVDILPVMKDFAVDVHDAKLKNADFDNVTTLCDAVNTLAEAASKAPSVKAGGGFAKVAGVIAAGGYISWPLLDSFTKWIINVAPIMENLAINFHINNVRAQDCTNVKTLCEAVNALAEAANTAPGITAGGGAAKFAGGVALAGAVKISQLTEFTNWVIGVAPVMADFARNIKGDKANGINAIDAKDVERVKTLCEAVKTLAEAADSAPGVDVGAGLAKFAGGVGGGSIVTVPMLNSFKDWMSGAATAMCDIATAVKTYKFTDSDLTKVQSICEDVKLLGEAAGSAPSLKIAGGLYGGPFGFAIAGAVDIPQLDEFKNWMGEIIPVMEGLALTVSGHSLNPAVYSNVKTICESVVSLGTAVQNVEGIDILAGGGAIGPLIGGFVSIGIPDYAGFGNWISKTASAMGNLVSDISEAKNLGDIDYDGISTICTAVASLCEAVTGENTPGTEITAGFAAVGPVLAGFVQISTDDLKGFGEWVKNAASAVVTLASIKLPGKGKEGIDYEGITTLCDGVKTLAEAAEHVPTKEECVALGYERVSAPQITEFADWFTTVLPALQTFATDISEAKIDANAVTAVANAGKLLGEMAAALPKDEETTVLWGAWSSSTSTNWDTFTDNIEGFGKAMAKFSKSITGENAINPEAITAAATAGKILAELSLLATNLSALAVAKEQFNTFDELIGLFAQTIVGFSEKVSGNVDNASITAASQAGYTAAQTLVTLSSSGWESADVEAFKTKLDELAKAINSFSGALGDVDPSSAVDKVKSVVNMLKTMPTSFDGPGSFKEALKTLSTSGIDDFVAAFEDAKGDVSSAVSKFIGYFVSGIEENTSSATKAIEGMAGDCADAAEGERQDFYDAGGYLVEGFASGISASTWEAEAKAAAMAEAALNAAKAKLRINSPSKVFMKVGQSVPEGFAMGIDQLGGLVNNSVNTMADDALSGTKSAISRLSDTVDDGIDSQPTIRPVLDLTDVESGANSISGMFSMNPSVGVMANVGAISSMMNNNQNRSNSDVIAAIENLGRNLGNTSGDTYNVNGITYDDGSNVSEAVKTIMRAARVERRR